MHPIKWVKVTKELLQVAKLVFQNPILATLANPGADINQKAMKTIEKQLRPPAADAPPARRPGPVFYQFSFLIDFGWVQDYTNSRK